MLGALERELAEREPEEFARAVERLTEAAGALQAAAIEELLRTSARELEAQASSDPLTGLHNLRHLQDEIGRALDVYRRYEQPFALLLVDVDGLRRINDAHGDAAGDRVLIQVAMSLQRSIRSVDTAARIGSDEFCVLAPFQSSRAAATLGRRLAAVVREQVATTDTPPVSVSIGVVSCPEHGEDAEALLEVADRAMYRAKAAGEPVAVGDSGDTRVAEAGQPTT
jgi:diguanylate cyclase (GGDEF)-like protein